jgi:glycosyltransferase involved in cell wall biosynthesis
VFASSCETFGQILVEAMSAGLPIACSNRSVMPELLGDAGVYFDPEQPAEIASAIRTLFDSPELRSRLARESFKKAKNYSWARCADETFSFISQCARKPSNK